MKLTRFEDTWARAALAAIFPEGDATTGLMGIASIDVSGPLAAAMRDLPWRPAVGLRAAIWIVALAPIVVLGRFATIAGLSAEERDRVVARLSASSSYALRSLVAVLKTFGALLYAGDERVQSRLVPRAVARLASTAPPAARPALVPLSALRSKRAHVA